MSWLAVTMQNQRKQKASAEAITKAGGTVESELTRLGTLLRDDSLVSVTRVDFSSHSTTDAGLVYLQGLGQLQWLGLDNSNVTDAGLAHLQGLRQLQGLSLNNTNVTDVGLAHLEGWSQLHTLVLNNTKVTDAGLVHLQGLSQLQELRLDGTKVTHQGVKKLQQALPNCGIRRLR